MQWLYLASLIFVIGCLISLDWRFKLAFFHNAKQTGLTLAIAVWLFSIWDIFGIRFGIFFHGDSPYTLPFRILPEFPIEELFFLFVLSYTALLTYRFMQERNIK